MEMPVEKVIMAVNALDLKILSLENVELLQRMVPTDQEVSLFSIYLYLSLFKVNVIVTKRFLRYQ